MRSKVFGTQNSLDTAKPKESDVTLDLSGGPHARHEIDQGVESMQPDLLE